MPAIPEVPLRPGGNKSEGTLGRHTHRASLLGDTLDSKTDLPLLPSIVVLLENLAPEIDVFHGRSLPDAPGKSNATAMPKWAARMAFFGNLPQRMETNGKERFPLCLCGSQGKCATFEVAALLGFEPRQADSESAVLPLHHNAMRGEKRSGTGAVVYSKFANCGSRSGISWRNRPYLRSDFLNEYENDYLPSGVETWASAGGV